VAGDTQITALSQGLANGVLYVGGTSTLGNTQLSQLFGLRVDKLVQAARNFVIESQLMQDPEDPGGTGGLVVTTPDNNIIPNSVARYQTHLAVVDDQKTPRINEPVKIWADELGTVITIDGQQVTIGPGDTQYAQTRTGPDGTVVIVSDADDINMSALRVWAGFIDPYERVVVYPDHEWHGRMLNSYDDPNAEATPPDPTKANFSAAYNYFGEPLFTDTEKKNKFPAQVASAVAQMKAGVNPGGNSPAALAASLKTMHASDAASPYIAYTDLGGMHYAPSNALVQRTATITAPFGLQFSSDDTGNTTYTAMSHGDAGNAIDAIDGIAWDPNNPDSVVVMQSDAVFKPSAVRVGESIFSSFWHWLKRTVTKVEKVVVSVGEGITVGIAFILKGVKKFFKAIV